MYKAAQVNKQTNKRLDPKTSHNRNLAKCSAEPETLKSRNLQLSSDLDSSFSHQNWTKALGFFTVPLKSSTGLFPVFYYPQCGAFEALFGLQKIMLLMFFFVCCYFPIPLPLLPIWFFLWFSFLFLKFLVLGFLGSCPSLFCVVWVQPASIMAESSQYSQSCGPET